MVLWSRRGGRLSLFHVTDEATWAAALETGTYAPPSLAAEGFVHLSTETQWPGTLQRFFRGRRGLVLLVVDPARLAHEVRYEAADGDRFPHLYGPLETSAVVRVDSLELGADGVHVARPGDQR